MKRKYSESEMSCWRRMEKVKGSEKVTSKEILERSGEKRTLLNHLKKIALFMMPQKEK